MTVSLPAPISEIVVPTYLAPSSWQRLEQCPLSVWGAGAEVLPESVKSRVGSLLHAARNRILRENLVGPESSGAVRSVIDEALREGDDAFRAVLGKPGASLVAAFGARRWIQRVCWIEAWARSLPPQPRQHRHHGPASPPHGDHFALGSERTWCSEALRLRGRPDEALLTEGGEVLVRDFKTGFVVGGDGALAPAIEAQIRLYLLMAETLSGTAARGEVIGGDTVEVVWDDEARAESLRRVTELTARYPAGTTIPATRAARPGSHCVGCRLRPRCSTYLEHVPVWWPNTGDHQRPLPLDTWGRVICAELESIGVRIDLEDPFGRRVLVRGLESGPGIEDAVVGTSLYFFDLEATEDRKLHGRVMQPRSFHERPPGQRWARAWTVMAFQGIPSPGVST